MNFAAALLLLTALGPNPRAISYSLVAGRCNEQVAPGTTETRSTLADGTTAPLSAVFRFSRLCGGHGKPLPCPATPLQVHAAGGLTVASVRGTDIQVEAHGPGRGAIVVRARKKLFPPLSVRAAVPAGLAARVSSSAIAFPELRSLRIAEGGKTALWLYPVDDGRRPLCAALAPRRRLAAAHRQLRSAAAGARNDGRGDRDRSHAPWRDDDPERTAAERGHRAPGSGSPGKIAGQAISSSIARFDISSASAFSSRGTCCRSYRSKLRSSRSASAWSGLSPAWRSAYSPLSCRISSCESAPASTSRDPRSRACFQPRSSPSYSATLLVCFPRYRPSRAITLPAASVSTAPAPAGPGFPRAAPSE